MNVVAGSVKIYLIDGPDLIGKSSSFDKLNQPSGAARQFPMPSHQELM